MVRKTLDGGVPAAGRLVTVLGGDRCGSHARHGPRRSVVHPRLVGLVRRSRVERVGVTVPIREVVGLDVQGTGGAVVGLGTAVVVVD